MQTSRARVLMAVPLVIACVVAMCALAACAPTLPTTPPGITGKITTFTPSDGRPANFLVEGETQPPGAVSDKAYVTINTGTTFFDAAGKPTSTADVGIGTNVRVWFNGPVAESYPVQGAAGVVQILGE